MSSCGAVGEASLGTAAMIAYYWLQREEDIIARLSWTQYRPADVPDIVRIFHHKTGKLVDMPLYDEDGTVLWPELMDRLDSTPRNGTLIVTRDRADRHRKLNLPWKPDYFASRRDLSATVPNKVDVSNLTQVAFVFSMDTVQVCRSR
jgi:hypothetical protein